MNCELSGLRDGHLHLDGVFEWILRTLGYCKLAASVVPLHFGRCEEIDIYAIGRTQISADVVVSGQLREGSRATRPLLTIPNFLSRVGVVRIVERSTVGLNRPGSQNGVVEHAFHAVAVFRFLSDTQQVARDLEVTVGATGSFETGMGGRETIPQLPAPWLAKALVGTPSARDKALRGLQHFKTVLGCPEMLLAAKSDIGLHRRTESVHVTVSVFEWENVVSLGKRVEVGIVFKIFFRHIAVERISTALVGEKEVFRQSVGFVPSIGSVFM